MMKYLVVSVALVPHHGSTNLTHSNTMSPSVSMQHETGGNAIGIHLLTFDFECRALQVRLGKSTADFQFLAYRKCSFSAYDLQADNAAALTSLQGDEVFDLPEVKL